MNIYAEYTSLLVQSNQMSDAVASLSYIPWISKSTLIPYWNSPKSLIWHPQKNRLFQLFVFPTPISQYKFFHRITNWAVPKVSDFWPQNMIFSLSGRLWIFGQKRIFSKKQHIRVVFGYHVAILGTTCCQLCQLTSEVLRSQIFCSKTY